MFFFERLTLSALIVAAPLTGCGVYRLQQSRLETKFQRVGVTDFTAALDNGEVHYWVGGNPDGKPLLLVHGFGGDALWGWAGQSDLARDHLIIAPDLLWFGASHTPSSDASTAYQAETIVQLLDHLAIDQVDVVGISYGGFVSLELGAHHGERVDRMILVDSPGHTYSLADYRDMLDRLSIDSVTKLVVPDGPKGVRRLVQLAYHRPPPIPGFVAKDIYTHVFTRWTDQKVRLLDDLIARADEVQDDAYVIDAPVLVLWGEHDELFPASLGRRLADNLGAAFELIPGTNHAPNLERARLFNDRVRAYLAPNGR